MFPFSFICVRRTLNPFFFFFLVVSLVLLNSVFLDQNLLQAKSKSIPIGHQAELFGRDPPLFMPLSRLVTMLAAPLLQCIHPPSI